MLGAGKNTTKVSLSMKKLLYLFLFFSNQLVAQIEPDSNAISRHRPGFMWYMNGWRPIKDAENRRYDRLIVDLTYNDWTGSLSPFHNRWNSIGVNVNCMFDVRAKKNQNFSFGWGFAYSYFKTSCNYIFADQNGVNYSPYSVNASYNTLRAHRFYVPLELRFCTSKWQKFKFHLGGFVGVQPYMNQTQITIADDYFQKFKTSLSYHNWLCYGVHARIGVRNWALFASYQFSALFEKNNGIQLHPLQFGLSISLF